VQEKGAAARNQGLQFNTIQWKWIRLDLNGGPYRLQNHGSGDQRQGHPGRPKINFNISSILRSLGRVHLYTNSVEHAQA
jgi:hypothetical protein